MTTQKIHRLASPEMVDAAEAAARAVLNEQDRRRGGRSAAGAARSVRLDAASRVMASKPALGSSVVVATGAELAARLNDATTGDAFLPQTSPQARLLPGAGRRVVERVNVIPVGGEWVHRAVEDFAERDQAAAVTPWGTSLPESSVSFDADLPAFHRIGSHVTVTEDVWSDKGVAEPILREFLDQDVWSRVDAYILSRASIGLLTSTSVPTAAHSAASRFDSIVSAAATVRGKDFVGRITALVNPADAALIVNERDELGERAFSKAVLEVLDVELAISAHVPAGTALVGDLASSVDLFVKERGLVVMPSLTHGSNFTESLVTVRADLEGVVAVQRPRGLFKVTGLNA